MARFILICTVDAAKLDLFARLRAAHYRFLTEERSRIVFGGPARAHEGDRPETMVIVIEAGSLDEAKAFSTREPYTAHGGFSHIAIQHWTQIIPELEPGALRRTLEAEQMEER